MLELTRRLRASGFVDTAEALELHQLLGGVSRRTVLRELDAGELVRIRLRGRVMVDPDSIRRYIERHRESGS